MSAIKEVKLVDQDGIGIRAKVGNGATLHAGIDAVGVRVSNNVVDLQGSSTIDNVPDLVELCYRGDESFPTAAVDELLAPCVDHNPFNDASPLAVAPLAVQLPRVRADPHDRRPRVHQARRARPARRCAPGGHASRRRQPRSCRRRRIRRRERSSTRCPPGVVTRASGCTGFEHRVQGARRRR